MIGLYYCIVSGSIALAYMCVCANLVCNGFAYYIRL